MKKLNKIPMYFKTGLFLILAGLILNSCSSAKFARIDNNSIVAISATSTGLGAKGYGILITMQNIDTKEIFKSKSISPISAHSVIPNLKPGKYNIIKVEVPVGNIMYSNWSDNVRSFFGQVEIEPESKYYFGDFTGSRKIGKKNVLRLKIESENIPEKIRSIIENETGWNSGEFIKLFPYNDEELLVF